MKKYCSECRQPLADPQSMVCDKCGRPTTPVGVFDTMASENCLSGGEKRGLEIIGIVNIAACVISLIQWIVMLVSFADARAQVTALMSSQLFPTAEEMASYRASIMVCNVFTVMGVIMLLLQLAAAALGVMIFLKKVWAVRTASVMYIINVVLYVISGNIISAALTIYLIVKLNSILSKMAGGAEYIAQAEKLAKEEAEIAADRTKWRCKSCGFINGISSSECKSCGKWKQ